ncbi:Rieske (2Fe-2S) protein [Streptomyces antarcticus]|uniref:Rieske (2Fe-2S) protein n=1 Tax=Streptomyces antarcticus TaxID=2996458 RepID=UPI00227211CE|nr:MULTISPECIES: Rieske (2Fe-2S) protein [unclassified Streptomyces]MCY0945741.1 Rieske (2Fe-2S) protein [Streptomyces sp. H34-AA3]MCY0954582.1 Rieske (2Fe-2S) protein [Streptomyces sp. H27-S2]MCZ4084719.1 Rieske (2Fe-2S) protein [Streptomyces sp. H34-S5]
MSDPTRTARRTVLAAGAATLAGGALAACGGDSEPKPVSEPGSAAAPSAAASAPAGAVKALAKATEVPVGGGKVLKDEKLVITQPTAGEYRCFSAVCTHSGCLVNKVADGTIDCPCHDSKFKDTDGAVTKGPATHSLTEKKITVAADGNISLA